MMGPLKSGKKLSFLCLISLFFACGNEGTVDSSTEGVSNEGATLNFTIKANVIGLKGSNMVVTAGSKATTINSTGSNTLDGQFTEGSTVSLTITSQPTSPIQLCSFEQASITVEQDTTVKVLCQDVVNIDATNYLGGGLKLTDNNGDTVTVTAGSQQGFSTPIIPGSNYSVSISQQSNAPYQPCSLQNDSGTYNSAIPTVTVTCERFFLLKQVKTGGSSSVTLPVAVQGGLFFGANDGADGAWFSDGTPSGTVKKLSGQRVLAAVNINNTVYFASREFKTNPSSAEDALNVFQSGSVTEVVGFSNAAKPRYFAGLNDIVYYETSDKLYQLVSGTANELIAVDDSVPHAVAANGGVYYVKPDGNLAVYLNSEHTSLTTGITVKEILAASDALYFVYGSSSLTYLGKVNYSNYSLNSYSNLNSTGWGEMVYLTQHAANIYAFARYPTNPQYWRLIRSGAQSTFFEYNVSFKDGGPDYEPSKPISDSTGLYFTALDSTKTASLKRKDLFVVQDDQITKLVDQTSGVGLYSDKGLVSAGGTVYFLAGAAYSQLYLYQSQGDAATTKTAAANQITDITEDKNLTVSGRMLYLPVQTASVSGIQLYGYLLPP